MLFFLSFSLTLSLAIFIFVFRKSFSILSFLLLHSQILSFILHILAEEFRLIRSYQPSKTKNIYPIKRHSYSWAPLQSNVVSWLPVTPVEDCYKKYYTSKAQACLLLQFHLKQPIIIAYNYSTIVLSMKMYSTWEGVDFPSVAVLPPGSKLLRCFVWNKFMIF